MAELGAPPPEQFSTWGMWAAEPPQARVTLSGKGDSLRLNGRKAWCSGANALSHALITVWDEAHRQQLVAVRLDQPGVHITNDGWRAVGMGATGSVQGGIGIAACWYGASRSIAQRLLAHIGKREEPHALAHLGAVDVALHAAIDVLRAAAVHLDQAPTEPAEVLARRCR
ncbi:hypothetical protein A259_30867, partial [Pseudomonas syringae pv. actinidiae ICMP 19070]